MHVSGQSPSFTGNVCLSRTTGQVSHYMSTARNDMPCPCAPTINGHEEKLLGLDDLDQLVNVVKDAKHHIFLLKGQVNTEQQPHMSPGSCLLAPHKNSVQLKMTLVLPYGIIAPAKLLTGHARDPQSWTMLPFDPVKTAWLPHL
jgi:hypothetical protein